jgi:hypothetical protein
MITCRTDLESSVHFCGKPFGRHTIDQMVNFVIALPKKLGFGVAQASSRERWRA